MSTIVPTEDQGTNDLLGLTATVVSAYLSQNRIQMSEIPALIDGIHAAFAHLGLPAAPLRSKPPVPIKRTITPDAIISLEDGKPYKTLKRHLTGRGFTPAQYREKWGLPADYPMIAPNYSAQRAKLARATGLGSKGRKTAPDPAPEPTTKRRAGRKVSA